VKVSRAKLLLVIILATILAIAISLIRWSVVGSQDLEALALNLGAGLLGAVATYVLLEVFIGRGMRTDERKKQLILELGSRVSDVSVAAASELRKLGWLTDGTLTNAHLAWANLSGAPLAHANLMGAILAEAILTKSDLRKANLCSSSLIKADLNGADLTNATLAGANLENANLTGTILRGAEFTTNQVSNLLQKLIRLNNLEPFKPNLSKAKDATFNENTILPDGSKWTAGTDMKRFTERC
jgi:hypothetical protein